jgi:dienelactone hydrolase
MTRSLAALALATAIALAAPGRALAAGLDEVGHLWLPTEAAPSKPMRLVIALYDLAGADPRGWHYADQLTAAGIAVLHVELLETSADSGHAVVPAADDASALGRLTMVMSLLAKDPRFARATIGLLALGTAGQPALLAAADPVHRDRVAGLGLLYPGCAAMAGLVAERARALPPVLLLHGDADPANPPGDCMALADLLAHSAPVRRQQYAGVGYAWDLPTYGPHERVRLPWPGRPGEMIVVTHSPEAAEIAATHVAAFLDASFAAHGQ